MAPKPSGPSYDVVVVGAGVNGTGIARDAAMRGLRVALVDQRDIAGGASSANSGMIHGGVRYLLSDVAVTKHSCRDAGYIRRIAGHLCFRIPFLFPIFKSARAKVLLDLTEVYFSAYDRYQPLKGGRPHCRLTAEEARALEPGLAPNLEGAITFDEWGISPFRLCLANAISAREHGAELFLRHRVEGLLRDRARVSGVLARDLTTGELRRLEAATVMNAAGAWAPRLCAMAGAKLEVRPSKGVHLVYDRRYTNYAITCTAIDGRQVFIEPHENSCILGTTDDDYYGPLEELRATEEEVAYLRQAIAHVVPALARARVVRTMVGIRPTLHRWGVYEDDLSRDHRTAEHPEAPGLFYIIGGKLAAYRLMSEEATDVLCAALGHRRPCRTHEEPLPGADGDPVDADRLAADYAMNRLAARRLVYRQGSRARGILARQSREGADACAVAHVCKCEPVTVAEVRHAVEAEEARGLDDVRRRTRLGMGPCQAMRCAAQAGAILGERLGWDALRTHQETLAFLEARWRGKHAVLGAHGGPQLAQEELSRAKYLLLGGYGRLPPG